MPATKAEILDLAKALPYDQRWELVEELEATLHPPPGEPLTEEEFRAELDRRWAELDAGIVKGIPWSEVKAAARRRFGLPDHD